MRDDRDAPTPEELAERALIDRWLKPYGGADLDLLEAEDREAREAYERMDGEEDQDG